LQYIQIDAVWYSWSYRLRLDYLPFLR
jgi:hypothetical protein